MAFNFTPPSDKVHPTSEVKMNTQILPPLQDKGVCVKK